MGGQGGGSACYQERSWVRHIDLISGEAGREQKSRAGGVDREEKTGSIRELFRERQNVEGTHLMIRYAIVRERTVGPYGRRVAAQVDR